MDINISNADKKRLAQLRIQTRGTMKTLVPCRVCVPCRMTRAAEHEFRLKQELKHSLNAHLITLTFDHKNLPRKKIYDEQGNYKWVNTFRKKDHQLLFKKLRKYINSLPEQAFDTRTKIFGFQVGQKYSRESWPKLKYYLVSEYGTHGTQRPHYHLILFNAPKEALKKLGEKWEKGNIDIRAIKDENVISYLTSYLNNINTTKKKWEKETGRVAPFSRMSHGIGKAYIDTAKALIENNQFEITTPSRDIFGRHQLKKIPIPKYYLDRIAIPFNKKLHATRQKEKRKARELEQIYADLARSGIKNVEETHYRQQVERANKILEEKLKRKNKL